MGTLAVLSLALACKPARHPDNWRCEHVETRRGDYDGYRVEWTCHDGEEAYAKVCPLALPTWPATAQILHGNTTVVIRGNGHQPGRRALRDRILEGLKQLDSWDGATNADACTAQTAAIIVMGGTREVDQVVQLVGQALRAFDANDQILIQNNPLISAEAL